MSLLALSIGQDLAYMSINHFLRIVMVIGGAQVLFRSALGQRR